MLNYVVLSKTVPAGKKFAVFQINIYLNKIDLQKTAELYPRGFAACIFR
jgi:hypothetical protein